MNWESKNVHFLQFIVCRSICLSSSWWVSWMDMGIWISSNCLILHSCSYLCINSTYQEPLSHVLFVIVCAIIRFFQLHGDLDDLESALGGANTSARVPGSGSCSALVKLLSDDLLVGHNTWTSYYNMLRIYKLYDLRYHISPTDGESTSQCGSNHIVCSNNWSPYTLENTSHTSSTIIATWLHVNNYHCHTNVMFCWPVQGCPCK